MRTRRGIFHKANIARIAGAQLLFSIAMVLSACGSDKPPPPPPKRGAAAAKTPSVAAPADTAVAATADAGAPIIHATEYAENDFVENDRNRDPFRSFVTLFVDAKQTTQRHIDLAVILPQYSIDELRLMGIVTGSDYPRAMLIDPTGKGWIVKHGDFLGKPDIVHTGGANGADYQLYWRVDRVREGDVVLVREDPAQPNIAPATRIIPLHAEGETRDRDALEGPAEGQGGGAAVAAGGNGTVRTGF
jgi:type IV pilus assembly protein PilP